METGCRGKNPSDSGESVIILYENYSAAIVLISSRERLSFTQIIFLSLKSVDLTEKLIIYCCRRLDDKNFSRNWKFNDLDL